MRSWMELALRIFTCIKQICTEIYRKIMGANIEI